MLNNFIKEMDIIVVGMPCRVSYCLFTEDKWPEMEKRFQGYHISF
jgi:hypothetical protein